MHRDDLELLIDTISRRSFLAGGAALAGATLVPWNAFGQSAPHSFMQGDFEVLVVSDGMLMLPLNVLAPEASPEQLSEIAKRLGWTSGNAEASANIPLIKSGTDLILFDNGSGKDFQPTAGKLSENLAAAGIDPASVTKVAFTHAHPDHLWGTLAGDGALRFPNATYYVGQAEWDFWMNPEIFNQLPADFHGFAKGAQRDLGAIKDRVTMVKGGDSIVTGISVLDTPGHTPGHLSFEIAGGEGLIVTGDTMVNEIAHFEHPEWKFGFDADPDLAIKTRKTLVDRAAADKVKLLGYHFAYPGVGFAEKKDMAYRFVAAG